MSSNSNLVRVVLYFNGRIVEGRRGFSYEGERRPTRINRYSTIDELHQRIRQKLALADNQTITKVSARLWHSEKYGRFKMVDDEDVDMVMEEFFNQSRKDFLELYVDVGETEDVLPVRSVGLNSPVHASFVGAEAEDVLPVRSDGFNYPVHASSSHNVAPLTNTVEEDEDDPNWVMDDDEDDIEDDLDIAEEDRLLAEDNSASDGDNIADIPQHDIPERHETGEG